MSADSRRLTASLAALAGFVDALGHLSLGGFFVAFMSGNSTLLGIGAATVAYSRIGLAAGLVGSFVFGVVFATLAGQVFRARRQSAVLALVAGLLALAWVLQAAGGTEAAGLFMAAAMGAENAVYQAPGRSGIGITYMTGALVRVGLRVAEALTGKEWRPAFQDFLLWAAMIGGALAGALTYRMIGLDGLWAAFAATAGLSVLAWFRGARTTAGQAAASSRHSKVYAAGAGGKPSRLPS